MNNVTYLLGAGSSADTLPTVKDMVERLGEVNSFLLSHERNNINSTAFEGLPTNVKNYNKYILEIVAELDWLREESFKHQTIDTLAKRLYLTGSNDLNKLKKALICYFTIEQLLNIPTIKKAGYNFEKKKELRYDSFIATLLEKGVNNSLGIPANIKMLTWNYDQQLELALKSYFDAGINTLKSHFQIIPNKTTADRVAGSVYEKNRFTCVKLNGNATWFNPKPINESETVNIFDYYNQGINNTQLLGYILEEYDTIKMHNIGKSLDESLKQLNFSWESDKNFANKYPAYYFHKEAALEIAKKTDYLVIIGYSFPLFNRSADKELIDNMENLKKIYIQDPNCESIQSIITNGFNILNKRKEMYPTTDVKFYLEKNTSQFLIPFEL